MRPATWEVLGDSQWSRLPRAFDVVELWSGVGAAVRAATKRGLAADQAYEEAEEAQGPGLGRGRFGATLGVNVALVTQHTPDLINNTLVTNEEWSVKMVKAFRPDIDPTEDTSWTMIGAHRAVQMDQPKDFEFNHPTMDGKRLLHYRFKEQQESKMIEPELFEDTVRAEASGGWAVLAGRSMEHFRSALAGSDQVGHRQAGVRLPRDRRRGCPGCPGRQWSDSQGRIGLAVDPPLLGGPGLDGHCVGAFRFLSSELTG